MNKLLKPMVCIKIYKGSKTRVLLDADQGKKDQNHGLQWLRQIQKICYDAEDVLEGFELQDNRKQVVKVSGCTRMKVHGFFSSSN